MKPAKSFASVASLIIVLGLVSTPALAGGGRGGSGGHSGGGGHFGGGGHSSYGFSNGHGFGGRGYYRGGHGGYGGYGYGYGGGHALAYAVPLALFGGYLFGRASAPRQQLVYSQPLPTRGPASRENVWVAPAPVQSQTRDQYCREYTTEIMVNGEAQEAFGQACRQDDGSWRIVSQSVVPDFQ